MRNLQNFQQLEWQILLTLAYTDQFQFPLIEEELWGRLVWPMEKLGAAPNKKNFQLALFNLVKKKIIFHENGFYFLTKNLPSLRHRREKISQEKWWEVQQFIKSVRWIPGLHAVFVTGSLAMNNATENQDVDFLIVTEKNCLWIVRPLVVFATWLQGKKRPAVAGKKQEQHTWCLNLWLDTAKVTVPSDERTIYQAYEVSQAKLVWSRGGGGEMFYAENAWVREWLPNFHFLQNQKKIPKEVRGLFFLRPLNFLFFLAQRLYMDRHLTTEKVGLGYAFFHPRNTVKIVTRGWQSSLRKVKLSRQTVTILLNNVTELTTNTAR